MSKGAQMRRMQEMAGAMKTPPAPSVWARMVYQGREWFVTGQELAKLLLYAAITLLIVRLVLLLPA